jgi:large subunit ribosomal protein L35
MKLKSRSSTKKRVKATGSGKVRMQKSAKKHLLAQKSKRQKGLFKSGKPMTATNSRAIRRQLPYL